MKIYMIGIKGSGMASLAQILIDDGYEVKGKDISKKLITDEMLLEHGIVPLPLEDKTYLTSDIVIVGHSFIKDSLVDELNTNKKMWFEYNEFLGLYLEKKKLISICGSHGKTTTVHLLENLIYNSSFLCGDGTGRKVKDDKFFFLESCEYKNHFLAYYPEQIIITNIDFDHVDFFKTEEEYITSFKNFAKRSKKVYILYSDKDKIEHEHVITFGLGDEADYHPIILNRNNEKIIFTACKKEDKLCTLEIPNYGNHFLEEFLSVIAFFYENDLGLFSIEEKMKNYLPPKQRFQELEINGNYINVDYAHHPKQIINNYQICQEKHKKLNKIAIFKADRYSRIFYFKFQIKQALKLYDFAFILPIAYMEENIGKTSAILCDRRIIYLNKIEEIEKYIDKQKKYSISLMSSKTFFDEIEYLKLLLN